MHVRALDGGCVCILLKCSLLLLLLLPFFVSSFEMKKVHWKLDVEEIFWFQPDAEVEQECLYKKVRVGRTLAWRRSNLVYERRRKTSKEKCKEEESQVVVPG